VTDVSRVAEVVAERLRAPGFRTVQRGYDPDNVRDHLAVAHALVTQLERQVVETERRADALEAQAARAEVPVSEDDELLAVVFDGQRRADELVADAEATAAQLLRAADERVAELRDDSEVRRLRAEVEERQAALERTEDVVAEAEDDLHVTGEATRATLDAIGDRLAAALNDLREMERT